MTKEKFEKIKKQVEEVKIEYKELSHRIGAIMGILKSCEDITREEIIKLMDMLFLNKNF